MEHLIQLSRNFYGDNIALVDLENEDQLFTAWETLDDKVVGFEVSKTDKYTINSEGWRAFHLFDNKDDLIDYINNRTSFSIKENQLK